jgi:DeoR family transcriptional regulator of aga operon
VHGGAVPASSPSSDARPEREPSFEEALATSVRPKEAIGRAAAALVRSGQSVILDVGSTALQVARALRARDDLVDVTVFTNGLSIALELEHEIPRFTVIVTGGSLRPRQHSLVHPLAGSMLDHIHVDLAFLGCNGVDPVRGITNANLPEAEVKALAMRSAKRTVLVADASKLGRVDPAVIAPLDGFDLLVTAGEAPAGDLEALRVTGLDVRAVG